jgi:bifunctional DNA-binding transcriptional regulator/antitoxin component of YhaV-PrlF toxin-antitoxin module
MPTSTLTDKGQTTVPQEIRRALKLKPRQRIEWKPQKNGTALIRPARTVSQFAGCLKSRVPFPGLKKEKEAGVKAWAEEAVLEEHE